MGTKTVIKLICHCFCGINRIKLNNPLMGTETIYCFLFLDFPPRFVVKLNNPLTGPVLMSKTHISTKI